MKIVHFSFSKSGGAGTVANTLSTIQSELGHDSSFEFLTEGNLRKQPFRNPSLTIAASLDEYVVKNRDFENQVSVIRSGFGSASLSQIGKADVVHLHWIPGQISLKHLERVMEQAQSVVWTLHDMWPLTGGCHYSGECEEFKNSCSNCPAVKSMFHKSMESQLLYKTQIANVFSSKLKIVTPSSWLAKIAQSSNVFGDLNVSVIPNPVRSTLQSVSEGKHEIREFLSMSKNSFAIAFSAANLDDRRKGLEQLLVQLETMARENPSIEIELLLIGDSKKSITCSGVRVTRTGLVSADQAQSYLKAADVLVNFSKEENLSMSLIEALAAGLPIVALDSGGNSDVVRDGKTGYLLGASEEANKRLTHLAQNKSQTSSFAAAALEDFNARFRAEKVAKQYLELYIAK